MSSRPSQKRTATSSSDAGSSSHQSKKTRFLDPLDDPADFAEQVDSALENPSARRKGKVKTEGYDSDSSDDGEGVVPSRKKHQEPDRDGADDNADDMFAVGDPDEDSSKTSAIDGQSAAKKENYLRLGDIEGQEFGQGSGDDDDESDEPEDEDDAERRKKAGMGYELSSFNMREEMEEGKFTEDGSYVRSFDPHGVHDRWMEGLEDKDIKQARRRHRQREKRLKEKILAEEKQLEEIGGLPALERDILPLMKKGESILEALQRLGARKFKSQASKKGRQMEGTEAQQKVQADIQRITDLSTAMASYTDVDVYSKTYEELVRSVRSSSLVDQAWEPPSADIMYEYKWDGHNTTAKEDQTFGPFSEVDMNKWFTAMYFGSTGEKVKVRPVGGRWQSWDEAFS